MHSYFFYCSFKAISNQELYNLSQILLFLKCKFSSTLFCEFFPKNREINIYSSQMGNEQNNVIMSPKSTLDSEWVDWSYLRKYILIF